MKVQIYKVKNPNSYVSEIVEIKSDLATDTLTHFVPPFCPSHYSGGSNSERVRNSDGRMCSVFEPRSVFEYSDVNILFGH